MVSFGESSYSKKPQKGAMGSKDASEPRILSQTQLTKLKEHRYSCVCTSMLDPYLQPYWSWLVQQLPLWMAPNLITIVGLFVNVVTSLILVYYSPDCNQEVPAWTLLLFVLGLFAYQSLDAIDGKQARRTKSSSPLGELFDHGCDSVSTVFVSLGLCVACRLGDAPRLMFIQSVMAVTLFYCAHWQTYVTGVLNFGYFDVTEAQVTIMIIQLLTAIFGGRIWTDVRIPIVDQPLYTIYVVIALSGAFYTLWSEFQTILYKGAGKNGSSIAGTSVLSPVIPFALVIIPAIVIASKTGIYEENPAIYCLTFGLIAAKVTNRLVVAHMTKSEMDYFDPALLSPALLFTNQYFDCIIKESYLLYACLILVSIELFRYSKKVCMEICESLEIMLFKIPTPLPDASFSTPAAQGVTGGLPKLYSNSGGGDADNVLKTNLRK